MLGSGHCELFQRSLSPADKFDHILSQYRRLAGGESVGFNNAVFLAEKERAHRNFALGYYMKENGCFPEDVNLQQTMDLYFQVPFIIFTARRWSYVIGAVCLSVCRITCEWTW